MNFILLHSEVWTGFIECFTSPPTPPASPLSKERGELGGQELPLPPITPFSTPGGGSASILLEEQDGRTPSKEGVGVMGCGSPLFSAEVKLG